MLLYGITVLWDEYCLCYMHNIITEGNMYYYDFDSFNLMLIQQLCTLITHIMNN